MQICGLQKTTLGPVGKQALFCSLKTSQAKVDGEPVGRAELIKAFEMTPACANAGTAS